MKRGTERFSDRADAYSKHRPAYPDAAFERLLDGFENAERLYVADIGAGTGISTAQLASRVGHVYAIEPNADMRDRAIPAANVTWHDGTAENTGLPDRSVDIVAAFQAFHWFDAPAAFAEFRRIGRRRVALLQYERDENQAFSKAYGDMVRAYATDATEARRLAALEQFASLAGSGLRRHAIPFAQALSHEGMLGRLLSSSYLPQEGPAAEALRTDAGRLFAAFQCEGYVEMAMTLHVLTADL